MSSAPVAAPSMRNRTPATPTLSLAFAVTWTMSLTVALACGAVIETDGGFPSGGAPVSALKATMCMTHPGPF